MEVNIRTSLGVRKTKCYGLFEVNLDGTDVLFAFTDSVDTDQLEITDYLSGMSFPVALQEPSGETLGLDSPMRADDPYFVRLVRHANRLIDRELAAREMKRWRMLELIQMNQRKYQTNEIDF